MKIVETEFSKVFELIPEIHEDTRGYFFETYKKSTFNAHLKSDIYFIQENQSFSRKKFTFRGIHLQRAPFQQTKIVRVINGAVIDFVFNLNPKSPNFLKYLAFHIDSKNNKQIYLDGEYGHAFLTLEENTIVNYKTTQEYSKSHEIKICPFDEKINLDLSRYVNDKEILISKEDMNGLTISEYISD